MGDKEHDFIDEFAEMMKIKYDEMVVKKEINLKNTSPDFLWSRLDAEHGSLQGHSISLKPEAKAMEEMADMGLIFAILYDREKENLVNHITDKLPDDFLKGMH